MSKYPRLLISVVTATVLVFGVLVVIALAKAPEAVGGSVAASAPNAITPTITYAPHQIAAPGAYTFTYKIRLHHATTPPLTTTTRLTVTLDNLLDFNPATGTAVLPGDGGTFSFPGTKVIVWEPTLSYCVPITLVVTATGSFDKQTLLLKNKIETTVEWDGGSRTLTTPLLLNKIYLPLVMRNA